MKQINSFFHDTTRKTFREAAKFSREAAETAALCGVTFGTPAAFFLAAHSLGMNVPVQIASFVTGGTLGFVGGAVAALLVDRKFEKGDAYTKEDTKKVFREAAEFFGGVAKTVALGGVAFGAIFAEAIGFGAAAKEAVIPVAVALPAIPAGIVGIAAATYKVGRKFKIAPFDVFDV